MSVFVGARCSRPVSSEEKMGIQKFEDLIAWQKAYALCLEIYAMSAKFPKEEQYGLSTHIRKTALSCPSNIAEGFERKNDNEFKTFIRIALGSLGELKTQLLLAKDLRYLPEDQFSSGIEKINETRRILHGLRKAMSKEN